MPSEEWKPIQGYESRYEISNKGRVRSLDFKDAWSRNRKGKVLIPSLDKRGYPRVSLSFNNKSKCFRIHRLVAGAFILNLHKKRTVNHIDGVKINNLVSNLEWATNSENLSHAYRTGITVAPTGKEARSYKSPVEVLDMEGRYLYTVHGNKEMAEKGFDYRLVSAVTLGKRKSHKGHIFKREQEN
jgi:hypothetical protein